MKYLKILFILCIVIWLIYFLYRKFIRMKISKKGIEWLKKAEGFERRAYPDSKGLMTIGVGHLIKPGEEYLLHKTLTDKEVNDLLSSDLALFEKEVNENIYFPMSQHEYDAMVSFAFNIGYGARAGGGKNVVDEKGFSGSNVEALFNKRANKKDIANAFMNWKKPSEIIKRRAKEAALFLHGNYDYHGMPISLYNPFVNIANNVA